MAEDHKVSLRNSREIETVIELIKVRSLKKEIQILYCSFRRGTTDFFGLNNFQARLVEPDLDEKHGIYNSDSGIKQSCHPSWAAAVDPWTCVTISYSSHLNNIRTSAIQHPFSYLFHISIFQIYPPGLGHLLLKIKNKYNNPDIYIMKNGFPDTGGLDDHDRVTYSYEYMKQVLMAINQYGCNVKVYIIWSLMDDFEWTLGYT